MAALAAMAPRSARAQLRPLEPFDWTLLDEEWTLAVHLGGAVYDRQHSSLAGAEGPVYEVGVLKVAWHVKPVIVTAHAVAHRWLRVQSRLSDPVEGVNGRNEVLGDVGEVRIGTVIPMTTGRVRTTFRFGTSLPVSDAAVGLGRDQTDFHALLGAGTRWRGTDFSVEAGLGINGTYEYSRHRQVDVLLYSLRMYRRFGWLHGSLVLTGQDERLPRGPVRGNEDLQELRLAVRTGQSRWLQLELVRGFAPFSPHAGLRIFAGGRW